MAVSVELEVLTDIRKSLRDMQEFQRGASKSFKEVASSAKQVQSATTGIRASLRRAGEAAAGFTASFLTLQAARGAAAAVKQLTLEVGALGDNIAKTGSRIGIGVEALQELRFAGERVGISTNVIDAALGRLNKRLGEAKAGFGTAVKGLSLLEKQTGVTIDTNQSLENQFTQIIDGLSKVEDESLRVGIAEQFFGEQGRQLNNIIRGGAKDLESYRRQARRFGLVTEEQAKAAEAFADAQQDLGAAITGVRNEIGNALIPILTEATNSAADWLAENRQLIVEFVTGLPEAIRYLRILAEVAVSAFIVFRGRALLTSIRSTFTAITVGTKGAIAGLNAAKIAALGLRAAVSALKIAATFGLAFLIDAVINLVSVFAQAKSSGATTAEALNAVFLKVANFFRTFFVETFLEGFQFIVDKLGDLYQALSEATDFFGPLSDAFASLSRSARFSFGKIDEALANNREQIKANQEELDKLLGTEAPTTGDTLGGQAREEGERVTASIALDLEKEVQGIVSGVVGAFNTGGQAGAIALGKTIAGQFGPVGQALGEIGAFLAQGSEKVRENLTTLLDSIPQIIVNIVEGALAAVDVFFEKVQSGELFERILERIPDILEAIFEALPEILVRQFSQPLIGIRFARALIRNIPDIIAAFISGLREAAGEFVRELIDAVKGAPAEAVGLSRESGGAFGGIADIFGLQGGGELPKLASGANDGLIVRAQGGETIIDESTTERFKAIATALEQGRLGGGVQRIEVPVRIGEREIERLIVDMRERGFAV